MQSTRHVPVLLNEVLRSLELRAGCIVADGTLGGGGYTRAIAEEVGPSGLVVSLDLDSANIDRAERSLAGLPVKLAQANYLELPRVLKDAAVEKVNAIVLDLGISSDQIADESRGFSFHSHGELDLRFDISRGEPAWKLLQRLSESTLADIIYQYGEERRSRAIARAIVSRRRSHPIRTALDLAEVVRGIFHRGRHRIDPATKTFQALRIFVNDELESLRAALRRFPDILSAGGRLAVVSFHSLEDRIVKEIFRDDDRYRPLVRKPVVPTEEEIHLNPRARSAKLRFAERN